MSAPQPPTPDPDDRVPPRSPASASTSTGLDPRVAGLLAYLVGWLSGLVLYLIEKDHREVRFHAAQSILLSIPLIGLYIVLSVLTFIPVLGLVFGLLSVLVGFGSLALWVYLLVQGYQLNHVRLPVVGAMAEQWAAK